MQFNNNVEQIITRSREIAIGLGDNYISSHHFLLSVIGSENPLRNIFSDKKSEFESLKGSLQKGKLNEVNSKFYLAKEFERSLKISGYYSNVYYENEIKMEHIILSMLADKRCFAGSYLNSLGLTYSVFESSLFLSKKKKLLRIIGKNNMMVKSGFVNFLLSVV